MTLVVNPAAGTHRADRLRDPVAAALGRCCDVRVLAGTSAAQSQALVAAAAAEAVAAVVVLGGDGMVHQAVQPLAGGHVPLAVVPAGSGNDVAALLGIPPDPVAAAAVIGRAVAAGRVRRIDLGRVDAEPDGAAGPAEPVWWVTILCAGFDSAVNARANRMRWPRGPRRYDLATVAEALVLKPYHYRLELDGQVQDVDATMVSVGNGPQYGGGKRLIPMAGLEDGHLTVCVVAPLTRRRLLRLAPLLPTAGHVDNPAVSFHAVTRVRVDADREAFADGEKIGALPLTTTCVPGALPVVDVRGEAGARS